ncbi:carbon storage regulator CsrA [Thermincola ferriacetica]
MLALTRKAGESIIIDDEIEITVVEIRGDKVKIAIAAPKKVAIVRKEILDEVRAENKEAAGMATGMGEEKVKDLKAIMRNLNLGKKT